MAGVRMGKLRSGVVLAGLVALFVAASASAQGPVVNGGFETGDLAGWTATGPSATVVSGCHGGTYCAQLGATSATNGDSAIAQTFTAPSGGTLSFYYKVVCPDTVTYDWATATLKDNTADTTATVVPKTCTNSGSWVSASTPVTAGHSYTLSLTSHDDNYAGDATSTLYDDVTIATPPPPSSSILNGGFETGNLAGWTPTGAAAIAASGCHGGVFCAQLGSTSPTNGDSAIAQTFTPASSGILSFYYRVVCPDTVAYDWATATLKSDAVSTTTTLVPKTCTNSGSWVSVATYVTAGRSYTLTLTSHDDNYPGDATYVQYDDVAIH